MEALRGAAAEGRGDVLGVREFALRQLLAGRHDIVHALSGASTHIVHHGFHAGKPTAPREEVGYEDDVAGGGEIVGHTPHFGSESEDFEDENQRGQAARTFRARQVAGNWRRVITGNALVRPNEAGMQ